MANTRTENSLRNVRYAVLFQAVYFIVQFILRQVFVANLPDVYLGLNGTFSSIISMLSVSELGIGAAITYSMYKPIAEGDERSIAALVGLYKKVYAYIGALVAVLGLVLVPFLPIILGDAIATPRVYVFYALFVTESVSSYYLVYKQALIGATQRQYIQTGYRYGIMLIMCAAQMLFLVLTQDYLIYLVLRVAAYLLINVLLAIKADRMFPYVNANKDAKVDATTLATIKKNIKAMMMHKVGGVAVLGISNLLIAGFKGVVEVGKYSNYLMVTTGLNTLYNMAFGALIGSIGNLGATENPEHIRTTFHRINFVGNWLYGISAVCLLVLFQPFITVWVGEEWLFPLETVLVIAVAFYLTGMRNAVNTFKDTLGLFWYDRWKPVVECAVYLIAAVTLQRYWGVTGILAATLVSTLTCCFWVEVHVLYKYGFKVGAGDYFLRYGKNALVTVLAGAAAWFICGAIALGGLWGFLLKGVVCVAVCLAVFALCYCRAPELKFYIDFVKARLGK